MDYEDLDTNATYFVLMGYFKDAKWYECKLRPYQFDGFKYKLYAVSVDGNKKRMFYTNDFLQLLENGNGVFKKESDDSKIKHISWDEQIYNNAYVHHEADIIVSESE